MSSYVSSFRELYSKGTTLSVSYAKQSYDYFDPTTYTIKRHVEMVHDNIEKELKKLETYLTLESLIKPK